MGGSATAMISPVMKIGLITLGTQVKDDETQQRIAASALGELLGVREGEDLRVADLEVPRQIEEVPSTPVLYSAAMRKGGSRVTLREKLEAQRDRIFRERPVRMTPLSANYAYVGDRSRSGVGVVQS